jgi:Protein of unknown function (DUF3105)
VVIVPALSGGNNNPKKTGSPVKDTGALPTIPQPGDTNLFSAAKAAGCTLKTFPSEGRTHSSNPADWNYKTNPPTSGTHNPIVAEDGIYKFGDAPNKGSTTHALEHGRIDIQYSPALTLAQYKQLEALVNENQGYHQLLFKNQTNMPFVVAATAWTQQLGCPKFTPKVFDAIRDFRDRYQDQGPEPIP